MLFKTQGIILGNLLTIFPSFIMTIDSIIDLDDNTHYLLLDETKIENRKLFYAIGLTDDCNNPTDKYSQMLPLQLIHLPSVHDVVS